MTLHILALETSSSVCGVALLSQHGGQISVRATQHDATGEHAQRLLPMVDELLTQAGISRRQLAAVAFGQGPGGFTGLRVSCGVAQGIGFALDIPVIPVISLLAVAARDDVSAHVETPLQVIVQDARMGEVYLAAYQAEGDAALGWRELQEPVLLDALDVPRWVADAMAAWCVGMENGTAVRVTGDALTAYPGMTGALGKIPSVEVGAALRPDAETIARLALLAWHNGDGIAPDLAAPLYVRDKVAYTTLERASGQGGNPKADVPPTFIVDMIAAHVDDVVAIEQSVQAFPWTRGNFVDGLQAGYGAWVAMQSGRVAGFCMVMFAPDVAHVLVLAVSPSAQKKGIGAQLLARCEREARVRGLPALMLEVRPSNRNALAFYRHLGFVLLSMRKDYYPAGLLEREDACVMEKRL
jgi:tRNA threonylcarbamoyladenosine biosynthesis protein TsaB